MAQKKRNRSKAAKAQEIQEKLAGKEHLGEIITWNPGSSKHPLSEVKAALITAQLDPNTAKELLPRHAFGRAAKALSDDRSIDMIRDDGNVLHFQFTKKRLSADEWQFHKEAVVSLDKATGDIECADDAIKTMAQTEINLQLENRTTNDITKVIQKLFDDQSEMFPIRDQGGCYFVPDAEKAFVDQIEVFVNSLGGNIKRFGVPVGDSKSEGSVQSTVSEAIQSLIREHENSIGSFTANTRNDTMEHLATKIKSTRLKVEAYSFYLREQAEVLLAQLDEKDEELRQRISTIATFKANAPAKSPGSSRDLLYGHPMTAVIRWMGKVGWTPMEAHRVVSNVLGPDSVAIGTCRTQIQRGRSGRDGEPANLSPEQAEELEAMRNAEVVVEESDSEPKEVEVEETSKRKSRKAETELSAAAV